MQQGKNGNLILKIKQNKNSATIILENEKITISNKIKEKYLLSEGKNLSLEDIKNIKYDNYILKNYDYAFALISKKAYSEFEIKQKLYSKKLKTNDVNKLIDLLKKENLINDEKLSLEYFQFLEGKNFGENKIRSLFNQKHLQLEKDFSLSNEIKKAKIHYQKFLLMFIKNSHQEKIKKITTKLFSLGFSSEVIDEVLSLLPSKDENNEKNLLVKEMKKSILRNEKIKDDKIIKKKVFASLMLKGYQINDIEEVWEVINNENDK